VGTSFAQWWSAQQLRGYVAVLVVTVVTNVATAVVIMETVAGISGQADATFVSRMVSSLISMASMSRPSSLLVRSMIS